jgi:hypothetical protein
MEEVEMSGACNTHAGIEKCTIFYSENLKGINQLEDLDVHAGIILKWIFKKRGVSVWKPPYTQELLTGSLATRIRGGIH